MYPYDLTGRHPLADGPPRIYGARTKPEILVVQETLKGSDERGLPVFGPGRWLEFSRKGIVTAIRFAATTLDINQGSFVPFLANIDVDVVMNGKTHLATDGEVIKRLAPQDISVYGTPWRKVWIPIDQWDRWFVDFRQVNPFETTTQFVVRVEYFDEEPRDVPKTTTSTRFYKCEDTIAKNGPSPAQQLDFERPGIVTAMRCYQPQGLQLDWSGSIINFDVLMNGTRHLTGQNRNASPVNAMAFTPPWSVGHWFECYEETDQRDIWEVFPTVNLLQEEQEVEYRFLAQHEEVQP